MTNLARAAFVGVLVAWSSSVDAGDIKLMPGATCFPELTTDAGYDYSQGGILDPSDSSVNVVCPIVRDVEGNTDGLDALRVYLYIPPSEEIVCGAYSMNNVSGTVDSVVATVYGGAGGGYTYWNASTNLNVSTTSGYYFVRCELDDADEELVGYYWEEEP